MANCTSYHNGKCWGTRDTEYCMCLGDESKCDFYPEKRGEDHKRPVDTSKIKPSILDSGDRREFETGAVRDMAEGKGRMDLIPWDVALDIRGCMMVIYSRHALEKPLDEVLDRFATVEWLLNGKTKSILPENFEMAAAAWVMLRYYCNGSETFGTSIDADGTISDECINKIWATAMMDIAKHFEAGAKKYSDNNWRKGIPVWCYFDSASRHLMKYILGWNDEPHDRAVLWNLICGAWASRHLVECETDTADITEGSANACNAAGDASFVGDQITRQNT